MRVLHRWTKEECLIKAKLYLTKIEWLKTDKKSYMAANHNGWLEECCQHMTSRYISWTVDSITKEASKFQNIAEWKSQSYASYQAALRKKIVRLIFSKSQLQKHDPYSFDECATIAQKYNNRNHWRVNDSGSYSRARKKGWLNECCQHMNILHKSYSFDQLRESAKKYTSRSEWETYNANEYAYARKRGWIDMCCQHMLITRRMLSNDNLVKIAQSYQSISDWSHADASSYCTACSRNIIDQCTAHMKRHKNHGSTIEFSLLQKIQETFPKAQKIRFGQKSKGKHAQCFELDIYIPELRKGIEFNGTYFHSIEGLKRARPSWPDSDIQNYHQIKRDFFKTYNIVYLEIEEKDWIADKSVCLHKIDAFLGTVHV